MMGAGRRSVAAAIVVALLAGGCTYTLSQPGTSVGCGPLAVELNLHGVALSASRRQAVVDAVEEFGDLVGRSVDYRGETTAVAAQHEPGDPLLIELFWPDGAPSAWGFASPSVTAGQYREGWIYLNPVLASAPTGVIRRLVLHELGHIYGLDDVVDTAELMDPALPAQDYGAGDLVGLFLTHGGGCPGNSLLDALEAAVS